ncbi:hypothetical protein KQX54_005226 [Cotesia glomerata]|uniref:STPR domain-containing protein n=1 Tax=Cotesia glomerata TaxID=32391 RepID=A0AAV7I176_COTGL|nr:hypothetical protein KQX54_000345 [Cotesia glomerata]KAH0552075.1 hypothetical protein KQX54_005226 [Cotesia glomerata]
MPRKKSNIGRSTRNTKQQATKRTTETPQQQTTRLESNRLRASSLRANETDSERVVRVTDLRSRASSSRAAEKPDERAQRLDDQRLRQNQLRTKTDLNKAAFNYDKKYDYKIHPDVKKRLTDDACSVRQLTGKLLLNYGLCFMKIIV